MPHRRFISRLTLACVLVSASQVCADERATSAVANVPRQPFFAHIYRLQEALEVLGQTPEARLRDNLARAAALADDSKAVLEAQRILDTMCLAEVRVAPTGPPRVIQGTASAQLSEQGWKTFLVKVINQPQRTGRLLVESPNARPIPHAPSEEVASRWMQISAFEGRPMNANLSGLPVEYRILQIYSRDTGARKALLEFSVTGDPNGDRDLIREWRFTEDADGWSSMNQLQFDVRDGSLYVTSTGEDPFMGADVSSRGGPMLLRFWAKSEADGIGQLFWWTEDLPQPTADRQTNFLLEPGKEHLYEIPFFAESPLAGIRLDPLVKPGEMRIDWIDLHSGRRSGNWATLEVDFQCAPAVPVTFRIFDEDGLPAFARFEIRDSKGRICPAQSKRLAPDFFFQRHIYRGDGEHVLLPPGEYTVTCSRGPETLAEKKTFTVPNMPKQGAEVVYRVQRWIDPAADGWWSGDHHIHAAGCLHYENPTQGVQPEDMIRHIMGEDLKVGCCLTWGPCFDFQKRFFTGDVAEQSLYPYTLRYDVEVSGFGSHNSGHLNLLNLKEQIYPGGESKDHWPTLGLNTLRWARQQGAICGPAHSSIGLSRIVGRVPNTEGMNGPRNLPNYDIPAFDGIGANEFIMNVTHEVPGPEGTPVPAVNFISTMNTDRVAEWNIWYHVLNCGLRIPASGETDFPCMSGERVGIGRVYAQVDGKLTFPKWVRSIADGRSYVSDGRCHLLNFSGASTDEESNPMVQVGRNGSELRLNQGGTVSFEVDAATRLTDSAAAQAELIVNGYPVQTVDLATDGSLQKLTLQHRFTESGWAAVRVFPSAHTNPIYVVVDDQPVRGHVASVRWCLAGVKQCWKSKRSVYAPEEYDAAAAAYAHAEQYYSDLIAAAEERPRHADPR